MSAACCPLSQVNCCDLWLSGWRQRHVLLSCKQVNLRIDIISIWSGGYSDWQCLKTNLWFHHQSNLTTPSTDGLCRIHVHIFLLIPSCVAVLRLYLNIKLPCDTQARHSKPAKTIQPIKIFFWPCKTRMSIKVFDWIFKFMRYFKNVYWPPNQIYITSQNWCSFINKVWPGSPLKNLL